MTRQEMVGFIRDELEEFIGQYQIASEKAKPNKLKAGASGMLDMILGFGMLPPLNEETNENQWEKE